MWFFALWGRHQNPTMGAHAHTHAHPRPWVWVANGRAVLSWVGSGVTANSCCMGGHGSGMGGQGGKSKKSGACSDATQSMHYFRNNIGGSNIVNFTFLPVGLS